MNQNVFAFNAGQEAFKNRLPRLIPITFIHNINASKEWYRGWDIANLEAPIDAVSGSWVNDIKPDSQDVKDLDELIARLEVLRHEHGNLPVSVSVFQETEGNPYGSFYEYRNLSNFVSVQKVDGVEFVELCV